jgi:hypothetical protein
MLTRRKIKKKNNNKTKRREEGKTPPKNTKIQRGGSFFGTTFVSSAALLVGYNYFTNRKENKEYWKTQDIGFKKTLEAVKEKGAMDRLIERELSRESSEREREREREIGENDDEQAEEDEDTEEDDDEQAEEDEDTEEEEDEQAEEDEDDTPVAPAHTPLFAPPPAHTPLFAPPPALAVAATNVTLNDVNICFEYNTVTPKIAIDMVMGLFFTKVIKITREEFRRRIKNYLEPHGTDPRFANLDPMRTFIDEISDERIRVILDSITGSDTTENITYYSPESPAYDWINDPNQKTILISEITTKIITMFIEKTGIDVNYLIFGQINCTTNTLLSAGTTDNFFICNRENNENHYDVLYRSDTENVRFKIPDSGYCLFSALSLIYIIKTLSITNPEPLKRQLNPNLYSNI